MSGSIQPAPAQERKKRDQRCWHGKEGARQETCKCCRWGLQAGTSPTIMIGRVAWVLVRFKREFTTSYSGSTQRGVSGRPPPCVLREIDHHNPLIFSENGKENSSLGPLVHISFLEGTSVGMGGRATSLRNLTGKQPSLPNPTPNSRPSIDHSPTKLIKRPTKVSDSPA